MSIRQAKITFFETHLMDFFRKAGRVELPWRKPFDDAQGKRRITAYEVWVSEIMLQQTQVSRVIGYYNRFLERFPTVESLAKVSWEEFLPYYEGLGYYARGRNMLRAAEKVVSEYGGTFPRDIETLQTLPGIGPYTAAAIMSFAYGDKHLAWDTNLKRVIGRFFFGSKRALIDEGSFETKFTSRRKDLNAALMDFGSALCVSRPKCEACPLKKSCVYYRERGKQERLPKKQKSVKKLTGEIETVVTLHEKHRIYYSSKRTMYAPFTLPKNYSSRADIKAYFEKKYQLVLAVRPPHKEQIAQGRLLRFVHAQILLGTPTFKVFTKQALK